MQCQLVHEGLNQVICGKVEDQAEKNGDGQRGERLLEDGEEQKSQTQALQRRRVKLRRNGCDGRTRFVLMQRFVCGSLIAAATHDEDGHEAGQGGVPVAAGCGRGVAH